MPGVHAFSVARGENNRVIHKFAKIADYILAYFVGSSKLIVFLRQRNLYVLALTFLLICFMVLSMPIDERVNLESAGLDTAIVMATDPELRALGARILGHVLPDCREIIEVDSSEAVLSLISGRVALVMAFDDSDNQAKDLAALLFVHDRSRVSLFLVTDSASVDGDMGNLVDGILTLPLSGPEVLEIFNHAIAKRRGILMELEGTAKVDVLKEFVDYYLNLAKIWKKNVLKISLAPKLGETVAKNTPEEDAWYLLHGIDGVIEILNGLSAESFGEISAEKLRNYIHDLNNKLQAVISYPEYIGEAPGSTPEDRQILTMVGNEGYQLNSYSTRIRDAYNGTAFWQDVKASNLILQSREKLEISANTSFCVVDDDQGILRVTRKTIEAAGGSAILVESREALEAFFAAGEAGGSLPEIEVFLLDNNLGDGISGHQLIPMIRSKYPDALIIAHTSDDLSLNKDPGNEYKKAGVEVVGKRQWAAVSGVIRRKTRKPEDEIV